MAPRPHPKQQERRSTAPRLHFRHNTTTDKLARDLDLAAGQGLDVVVCQHVGGRDWVLITSPSPILGPAGSRVFHRTEE